LAQSNRCSVSKTVKNVEAPTSSGEEAAVLDAVREKRNGRTTIPHLKLNHDEDTRTTDVSFDHEDQTVATALALHHFGTSDTEFYGGLIKQVAALTEPGKEFSEDAANFALGVIRCIEPRDEIEAMLAAQMAATHQLTMQTARRLALAGTYQGRDSAERAYNKLSRTYTTQMDALKRHRAKAQQIVRVERVTVNEGGQAVVGDVSYERGAGDER
jgi:hypothetical protein